MSQFLRPALFALDPYVPGEQPQDKSYIKLNTNENPYPPAPGVMDVITREAVSQLKLYSDPTIAPLKQAKDAVLVDTSDMDIDTVIAEIRRIVTEKVGA